MLVPLHFILLLSESNTDSVTKESLLLYHSLSVFLLASEFLQVKGALFPRKLFCFCHIYPLSPIPHPNLHWAVKGLVKSCSAKQKKKKKKMP